MQPFSLIFQGKQIKGRKREKKKNTDTNTNMGHIGVYIGKTQKIHWERERDDGSKAVSRKLT